MDMITAILIDDGTLDTVIQVKNKTYRYNFDGGDGLQTYNEFVEWATIDAKEQYETDLMENEL